jgi:YegS/Rv2252/BmrU family lipid kinase
MNPRSGNSRIERVKDKLFRLLDAARVEYTFAYTEGPMHAAGLAAEALECGVVPVAVGGDGTLNEVINCASRNMQVAGLVPAGRGNDFARLVGIKSLEQAAGALSASRTRVLDIAKVSCLTDAGERLSRRFINTMGIGFDAEVASRVAIMSAGSGIVPYLFTVFKALRSFRSTACTVSLDGKRTASTLFLASVGNGTTSGGGFMLTPRAVPDDGLLDLCMACDMRLGRILRLMPFTLNGGHLGNPEVTYERTTSMSIDLDNPMPVHLDGEILTHSARRIEVDVLPGAVEVYCGEKVEWKTEEA